MNRSILAVPVWLAVGFGCGAGADGDDPPDPMLPLEGMWEATDRDLSRLFCEGAPTSIPPTESVFLLYTRHLRDRLYVSYGSRFGTSIRWIMTGIRCPVDVTGRWACHQVSFDRKSGTEVVTYEVHVSGSLADDPELMSVQMARESNCSGPRCNRDYCVRLNRYVLQHIPENRHDPD